MQTAKEIFLEMLKPDAQPERQLKQYEALHMCLYDPINAYLRGNRKRGTISVDRWGTTISFPEDAPGAMPLNHGDMAVCRDVTRWRETVHAPDIESACTEGWEECRKKRARQPGTSSSSPDLWARAYSSSAISSWALSRRSPTSMSTRTRCTSLSSI